MHFCTFNRLVFDRPEGFKVAARVVRVAGGAVAGVTEDASPTA